MPYQSGTWSWSSSWNSSDRVRYRKLRLEFRIAAIAHGRVEESRVGVGAGLVLCLCHYCRRENKWLLDGSSCSSSSSSRSHLGQSGSARRAKPNGLVERRMTRRGGSKNAQNIKSKRRLQNRSTRGMWKVGSHDSMDEALFKDTEIRRRSWVLSVVLYCLLLLLLLEPGVADSGWLAGWRGTVAGSRAELLLYFSAFISDLEAFNMLLRNIKTYWNISHCDRRMRCNSSRRGVGTAGGRWRRWC